jgi:DNA modification methylase
MEINKVHNIDFLDNTLPDKCANLIIADPPYFEVKGDFDFVWKSFDDYLKDVEKWALECKRLLADNGTLFWYGDSKKIAYAQIIFDRHFNLLSHITCHIYDRQTNKIKVEDARSFINTSERILMYDKGNDKCGNDMIFANPNLFKNIKTYLDNELDKSGYNQTTVRELLGNAMASHYFGFSKREKTQFTLPTKEQYLKLQKSGYFLKPYEELRKEYEELRKEYEHLLRPFNPIEEYKMDVLRVSQEGHITGKYDHDTVKPEKLSRILLSTCTKPDDVVVVPFAGSGTECAMAVKEKCNFYGFEIKRYHADMSNERVKKVMCNPCLPFD